MLVYEVTALAQFQEDVGRRRFYDLEFLSREEKQNRFGTPYTPIYVPLAPGETKEQYEARFCRWLETSYKTALADVAKHKTRIRERHLRIQCALLNRSGEERFVPPSKPSKRECAVEEEPTDAVEKKRKATMRLLTAKITEHEAKVHECPHESMDLMTDGGEKNDAAIERNLVREYETINERNVMNENVLDTEDAGLLQRDANAIAVATQHWDENNELRGMIDEAWSSRSVALANLVVFLYRHRLDELVDVIDAAPSSQAARVQKRSHQTCYRLAEEIREPEARLDPARQDHGLVDQRQCHWLTTLRFDAQACEVVHALLKRVEFQ